MAEVFISYARKDKGFVRDIHAALQKVNRDTWIDWRSIPESAKWRAEIFAAIEAADNFLFIISSDSVKSWMCGEEVSHAVATNKRLITILYHSVERKELHSALAEIQWIDYPELGFEETFERLIRALDTNLEWEHKHTQFLMRATEWQSKNHDEGFLLHGMELKEAVRWLEQAAAIKDRKPTELQEQYIRASEVWEAGEIRRLTDLNAEKERQARIAIARELVAYSTLSLQDDPERSILLAMHAMDVTGSAGRSVIHEAEDALHRAILRSSLRFTLLGHTANVLGVGLSRDGNTALSASEDNTLKVWDVESGRELRTLAGHTNAVRGVALSADGRLAVSASEDNTLKVWEVESGRELRTLIGHTNIVRDVALTPDGQVAVSASEDNTVKIWEVESGRELRTFDRHYEAVNSVAISDDGRVGVSASDDCTLKVWDVESGRLLHALFNLWDDPVPCVAISGDGRLAVSPFSDGSLKVWDLGAGRELRSLGGHGHGTYMFCVAFSADGRIAVSGAEDKTLKIWEVESGRELRTLTGHSHVVRAAAVAPDGQRVISASSDKTLKVWETGSGRELWTLKGHIGLVACVAISRDGRLAVSASWDDTLKVWDLATGREVRTLRCHPNEGDVTTRWSSSWLVSGAAISADGRVAVSASSDRTLRVWDLVTGRELRALIGHSSSVNAVTVTPDGQRVVSASEDQTLKVWDLESGRVLRTLAGHTDAVWAVAVAPDGQRVVSASGDQTLRVWDLESGCVLRTLTGHSDSVLAVAVAPDGQRAVSASATRRSKCGI